MTLDGSDSKQALDSDPWIGDSPGMIPMGYADLEEQALLLPEEQRASLASLLIGSLDDPESLSEEWQDELDRRMADLDTGRTKAVPAREVHAEMQRRYGILSKP